jgi:uncharacterized protein (DUF433 family)
VLLETTILVDYHKDMGTTASAAKNEPNQPPPADRVRIVSTPGVRSGQPRIDGHRITVADVAIWHERMGLSPDEIVSSRPSITLSDVHAALAYYYEHRQQIDADIAADEQFVAELKAKSSSLLQEKLRTRKPNGPDDSLPS